MNEDEMIKKFPNLFSDNMISFEVGKGWLPLIYDLLEKINKLNDENSDKTRVIQIKEKYGILTVYIDNYPENITKVIRDVEKLSLGVCENCGSTTNASRREVGSWLKTYCDVCVSKCTYNKF